MKVTLIVLAAVAAIGCNKNEGASEGSARSDTPQVAADNTGKNERDQQPSALTPGDQSETATDRAITEQVRRGVVKGDLSVNAKNVKIITVDGVVTLRGPVQSQQEKTEIAGLARQIDGVKRVDNQLEIASAN